MLSLKRQPSIYLDGNRLRVRPPFRPIDTLSRLKPFSMRRPPCNCQDPSAHKPNFEFGIHNPGRTVSVYLKSYTTSAFLVLDIPGLSSYVMKHDIELVSQGAKRWLKCAEGRTIVHEQKGREKEDNARLQAQNVTISPSVSQDAIVAGQRIYQGFLTPKPVTTTLTNVVPPMDLNTSSTTLFKELSQALKAADTAREKTTTATQEITGAHFEKQTATKALADAENKVVQLCRTMPHWQISGDRISLHAKLSEALSEAEKIRNVVEGAEKEVTNATRKKDHAEKEVAEADGKVDEICEKIVRNLGERQ